MSVNDLTGRTGPSGLTLPDLLDAIEFRLDEEGAKLIIELRFRLNRLVAELESRQMETRQREEQDTDMLRGLA